MLLCGDGSFQPRQVSGAGDSPTAVRIGDLNGDRIPDLVTTDAASGAASILIGNGDGTLQPSRDYAARDARAAVITDLNSDGEFNFFDVSALIVAFNAGCP